MAPDSCPETEKYLEAHYVCLDPNSDPYTTTGLYDLDPYTTTGLYDLDPYNTKGLYDPDPYTTTGLYDPDPDLRSFIWIRTDT